MHRAISLALLFVLTSWGWTNGAPAVVPSVAHQDDFVKFTVTSSDIQSVRLEIFSLAGQRIFDSGSVLGATYKWHLQRDDGQIASNGIYLYVVTAYSDDGRETRSAVGKLAVRR